MEAADFGGYATRAGLKCSDGRTITPEAFKHMHGQQVPLVWQHGHNSPDNILGHAVLEARQDGMYAYGFFNETPSGVKAREIVEHKDVKSLSIYANQLVEKSKVVLHGMIREVSLVLSGANPGAFIDFVAIQHSDGEVQELDDEAIISTGLGLQHAEVEEEVEEEAEESEEAVQHAADSTLEEIFNAMTPEQKTVVEFMIGAALESAGSNDNSVAQSDIDDNTEGDLNHQEGTPSMARNVFDQSEGDKGSATAGYTLTHSDIKAIIKDAQKNGSLKDAVEGFALKHGIDDIDLLFPDAKLIMDRPEFDKRRTEWVAGVLNSTRHSPFSRVKTMVADLTQDEARAKGYIKGSLKKEEWFGLTKRTTTPTTVYKKQTLDRDDVIDITDFDVVVWIKQEMRMMLEEELARAILIGDGRDVSDGDKIKDPIGASDGVGIRSIANDHELFATTVYVNVDDASSSYEEVIDAVLDGFEYYKGTGTPTFYTTIKTLNMFLKSRDTLGRRLYKDKGEVAAALGVRDVVTVDAMNNEDDLVGIIVNLQDYNIGADKGGEVNTFEDFDIDYNQQKYLIETRVSGALTKIKSALVIRKTASTDVLIDPITAPTFVASTGVVTIPTQTGVTYKDYSDDSTLAAGAQPALDPGESLHVYAVAASGKYFKNTAVNDWTFTRPHA